MDYTEYEKTHQQVKELSDQQINLLMAVYIIRPKDHLDFCSDTKEAFDFFYNLENHIFIGELYSFKEIYNSLLGRKPFSYSFFPSSRKKAEALVTIVKVSLDCAISDNKVYKKILGII